MTGLDTGKLRELAAKATPGPWFVVGQPWMDVSGCVYTADDPHAGTFVADCAPEDDDPEGSEHNAAYIAAASPDVVLRLLDAWPPSTERMADAVHKVLCHPFVTIDPLQCVHGRARDVEVAEALLAALSEETP